MNISHEEEFPWQDLVDEASAKVSKLSIWLFSAIITAMLLWASLTPVPSEIEAEAIVPTQPAQNTVQNGQSNQHGLKEIAFLRPARPLKNEVPVSLDNKTTATISHENQLNLKSLGLELRGFHQPRGLSMHVEHTSSAAQLDAEIWQPLLRLQSEHNQKKEQLNKLSRVIEIEKGRSSTLLKKFSELKSYAKNGYIARNRINERKSALLQQQSNVRTLVHEKQALNDDIKTINQLIVNIENNKLTGLPNPIALSTRREPPPSRNIDTFVTGTVSTLSTAAKQALKTQAKEADAVVINAYVSKGLLEYIKPRQIVQVVFHPSSTTEESPGETFVGQVITDIEKLEINENNSNKHILIKVRVFDTGRDTPNTVSIPFKQHLAGKAGIVRFNRKDETYLMRLIKPVLDYFTRRSQGNSTAIG